MAAFDLFLASSKAQFPLERHPTNVGFYVRVMLESSNLALKYAAEACCNTQAEVYLCTMKLSLHTLKIYS